LPEDNVVQSVTSPKIVQVEVTNKCNFSCTYCVRGFWAVEEREMDLFLFKKLSSGLQDVDKVALFGFGEPLTHRDFVEMVALARKGIRDDGKIVFSTNGSLLDRKIADRLVKEIGVNKVSFSLDTPDLSKLAKLRIGAQDGKIVENLRYLAKIKKESKVPLSLAIEVVLLRDNLEDLPELVKFSAEHAVDSITVTNVVAYSRELAERQLCTTASRRTYEIAKDILSQGWKIIHDSAAHVYSISHTGRDTRDSADLYLDLWSRAGREGYWINLPLLMEEEKKIETIEKAEGVFRQCERVARKEGIVLELPNLFADSLSRYCPYVENDATMVRVDGSVVPCQEFAYDHKEYVNFHLKDVVSLVFGNVRDQPLEKIWNSEGYIKFRQSRNRLTDAIPWCGDCVYSTSNCFYVRSNHADCQTVLNSCSECLYSAQIAKCVL